MNVYSKQKEKPGKLITHIKILKAIPRIAALMKTDKVLYVPKDLLLLYNTINAELKPASDFELRKYDPEEYNFVSPNSLLVGQRKDHPGARSVMEVSTFKIFATSAINFETIETIGTSSHSINIESALDHKLQTQNIWVHPLSNVVSTMTSTNSSVVGKRLLKVGFGLENSKGKIRFIISDGVKEYLSAELKEAIKIENLIIPVPPETRIKDLKFIIDPMGPNNYDWSYWVKPQLVKKSQL